MSTEVGMGHGNRGCPHTPVEEAFDRLLGIIQVRYPKAALRPRKGGGCVITRVGKAKLVIEPQPDGTGWHAVCAGVVIESGATAALAAIFTAVDIAFQFLTGIA